MVGGGGGLHGGGKKERWNTRDWTRTLYLTVHCRSMFFQATNNFIVPLSV